MRYSVVAIGDELLAGQVTDTNSGMIARALQPYGWQLHRVTVVSDTPADIRQAIESALEATDVVLTTGGLGPTKDDRTKQLMCEMFGGEMRQDPEVLANVKRVMAARGLQLNDLTASQAMVPSSCRVIQNLVGTAPLMWFDLPGDKVLVAMPGVPFETERMLDAAVIPQLTERFPSDVAIERVTTLVYGLPESEIARLLDGFERELPQWMHLAYLPAGGTVRLRLDGEHPDGERLHAELFERQRQLISLLPEGSVIATEDLPLEQVLLDRLRAAGMTFCCAESCTGGEIARRITSRPGASESFLGGVVSYANEVKHRLLGVSLDSLKAHGAVSREVVEQMAEGVRRAMDADLAVATSGIAGPGGGSDEKPVGTVWMAVATRGGVSAKCHRFPGSRQRVIDRAATVALLSALEKVGRE